MVTPVLAGKGARLLLTDLAGVLMPQKDHNTSCCFAQLGRAIARGKLRCGSWASEAAKGCRVFMHACSRSGVHAWGMFAEVAIGPEEFVAEYTGELIRASVNAARERFEADSDYRFRVDEHWVVDATRKAGLLLRCRVT